MKILTKPEVTLIDTMGSDLTVVNAARVSFAKESKWSGYSIDCAEPVLKDADAKLIKYLAKHNHWTPFGHITATFRIKASIFVARQLVKHQVGLVWNEESRRYIDDTPAFFGIKWRQRPDGSIKQGSGAEFDEVMQNHFNRMLEQHVVNSVELYEFYLAQGVAPEQARVVLPLNTATEWYWTGSVAAWSRVCKLRLDSHAQKETAEVADEINIRLSEQFPVSWAALITKE